MRILPGRNFVSGFLVGSLLFSGISYASSNIKLIVDGKEVKTDVPPQIIEGRTMVPARFLAESLGASVDWDAANHAVIVMSKENAKQEIITTEHLSFPLLKGWSIDKGLDSYVIKKGGENIGALEVLGYSPSVETLLPNGAQVLETKELEDMPLKVVTIKLITRATVNSLEPEKREIHYFYYLENHRLVYDLSFNLELVDESITSKIAKNVIVR